MHFQREQVSGDKEDREESGGGEEKNVKTKKKKRLDWTHVMQTEYFRGGTVKFYCVCLT